MGYSGITINRFSKSGYTLRSYSEVLNVRHVNINATDKLRKILK